MRVTLLRVKSRLRSKAVNMTSPGRAVPRLSAKAVRTAVLTALIVFSLTASRGPAVGPQAVPIADESLIAEAPGAATVKDDAHATSRSVARPAGKLRKLHLVRPDLIPYPIAFEVYC